MSVHGNTQTKDDLAFLLINTVNMLSSLCGDRNEPLFGRAVDSPSFYSFLCIQHKKVTAKINKCISVDKIFFIGTIIIITFI